jgi:tol-pal system protein YbgF
MGAYSPEMSSGMIRSALLLVVVLAWAGGVGAAKAQVSDSDLLTRLERLEATVRDLTGSLEQLQYHNRQLEQQVQSLQAALESRPGERRAGARPPYTPPAQPTAHYSPPPPAQYAPPPGPYSPPPPPPAPAPAPVVAAAPGSSTHHGDAFNPTLDPNAPGVPRPLGTSTTATEPPPPVSEPTAGLPGSRTPGVPLNLSTLSVPPGGGLPPPPPRNPSATGDMRAALPPSSTAKDEYDLAYGYVLHRDYGLAAQTFRIFLRKYPDDRRVAEAQYWLGDALFRNQQYHDAAEAFLAVSTKYGTTARAPDALLRLGESLAALGQKQAACASFGEVLRKYPRAALSVKQSVAREQKRVHC